MTIVATLARLVRACAACIVVAGVAVLAACGTPYATVPNKQGEPIMLLGHDPVSYVKDGKPVRGSPQHKVSLPDRTYYFASADNKATFEQNPSRFEPQYGGFCASGAAFALKLGSDPTAWTLLDGRLYIFGDVLGQTAWSLDPAWNVSHADALWPDMRERGWRAQSLMRYLNKVPHYKTGADLNAQYRAKYPGRPMPTYDPGGMVQNLFIKPPGWRAAEGFGQPALGYPD